MLRVGVNSVPMLKICLQFCNVILLSQRYKWASQHNKGLNNECATQDNEVLTHEAWKRITMNCSHWQVYDPVLNRTSELRQDEEKQYSRIELKATTGLNCEQRKLKLTLLGRRFPFNLTTGVIFGRLSLICYSFFDKYNFMRSKENTR